MTETFIIAREEAKIFHAIPDVKRRALSKDIIRPFPHILEYGKQKFDKIFLNSLNFHYNKGIEFCYVHKGRYQWVVEDEEVTLYPGDTFITCPWELHGSKGGFLDLGVLSWLIIQPEEFLEGKDLRLGKWSNLPEKDQSLIGKTIHNKYHHSFHNPVIGEILDQVFHELMNTNLGYKKRVNSLIEDLFILSARSFMKESCVDEENDCFDLKKLEAKLVSNLDHPWSVKEMAELVNMGVTSFIEKTKQHTGLTPINLLIDLRIKEAAELMRTSDKSFTEIAYECGFSSLQHFSDTFRKRMGHSPSGYQKMV